MLYTQPYVCEDPKRDDVLMERNLFLQAQRRIQRKYSFHLFDVNSNSYLIYGGVVKIKDYAIILTHESPTGLEKLAEHLSLPKPLAGAELFENATGVSLI